MQDRRVQKTKEAIRSAFMTLVTEKNLEEVTVKKLCEVANINKSTFYLHYRDIYHCAQEFEDLLVGRIMKIIEPFPYEELHLHFLEIWQELSGLFQANEQFYRRFLKSPFLASSMGTIKSRLVDGIMEKARKEGKDDLLHNTFTAFVIYGFVGVLEHYDLEKRDEECVLNALAKAITVGFPCAEISE